MTALRLLLVLLSSLCAIPAVARSPSRVDPGQLEIRSCPSSGLWSYPLDEARGLTSLVLHGVAVANLGATDLEVRSLELALLKDGEATDRRLIASTDLASEAASGPQVEALDRALPGQLCNGALLGTQRAASAPRVAPQRALVVRDQVLAWRGRRDAVRIVARGVRGGRKVEARATIPIRQGASRTRFRFPLAGASFVAAGATLHSHHRWGTFEEFALDLVIVDRGGLSHAGDGSQFTDYFVYGAPVLAAADGVVVQAVDGELEDPSTMRRQGESAPDYFKRIVGDQAKRLARGEGAILGNHVIVDHGGDEYSVYVHLQPASVRVTVGQTVNAGDQVGRVGSSGNSSEPHLHFQICDSPRALACGAVPPRFIDIDLPQELAPRSLQTGDFVEAR